MGRIRRHISSKTDTRRDRAKASCNVPSMGKNEDILLDSNFKYRTSYELRSPRSLGRQERRSEFNIRTEAACISWRKGLFSKKKREVVTSRYYLDMSINVIMDLKRERKK